MRADDCLGSVVYKVPDAGQRAPDTAVIANGTSTHVQRDVEIHSEQYSFPLDSCISEALLWHSLSRWLSFATVMGYTPARNLAPHGRDRGGFASVDPRDALGELADRNGIFSYGRRGCGMLATKQSGCQQSRAPVVCSTVGGAS